VARSILKRTGAGTVAVVVTALVLLAGCHAPEPIAKTDVPAPAMGRFRVERDLAVPMRDGIVLRADVYQQPETVGRRPVLVYRTPYGKHNAADSYQTHLKAVARNYVVVLQDVRGRHASDGRFDPYRQEGADGYDTIEWAAAQPWSNGIVGTYGLSYPGAVQWLAAMETPPHLAAMAPAMTFSSPRNFFYSNGVFDRSWLPWIYVNIAPDIRTKLNLPGIRDTSEAAATWPTVAEAYRSWLPLRDLPWLREEAPFYFEWLAHPPEDPWWDWAELRGRYARVTAAVLNLSGWYDEGYGPEGAATNFNGLVEARAASGQARAHLILGPWIHGVGSIGERKVGELDFGPAAAIDYDEVVLDFFDHYLRGVRNDYATAPVVRHFVMGDNEWQTASSWPPANTRTVPLYLDGADDGRRLLRFGETARAPSQAIFVADPLDPVVDAYGEYGPHDYRRLEARKDVLTFDTEPLAENLQVSGPISAVIHASCDCRDFDLWVRLQDVYPDGRAMNLMSPGNDVVRASHRDAGAGPQPLEPGKVYELRLPALMTSIRFARGHRIRAQISASFAPHMSRNLQTGESEVVSAVSRTARITIHHGGEARSHLLLPISGPAGSTGRP
jgi:putative CocE/NonD family hydrolase